MRSLVELGVGVLGGLPEGWTEGGGALMGWLAGAVFRYRWAEAAEAVRQSLPDLSGPARRRLLLRMYRNLGRTAGEGMRLASGRGERLLEGARLTGTDRVDELLARGRGLLILCAHLGNWELLAARTARAGYPCAMVVKEVRNPRLNDWLLRSRTRYGNRVLPRQNSFRDCLRLLKGNGILGFMLDQNMIRTEGVFVEFFGRPACTSPGLAYLSAQAGAPVIPVSCLRIAGGHEIRIGEPFEPPPDREPETIRAATQAYTRAIEEAIRRDPDQWTWIHRRWRTRPLAYAPDGRPGDRGA